MKRYLLLVFFSALIFFTSCSTYHEVLKSNDLPLKYAKAKEYYNKKDYYKAIPLFEELMAIYKGTKDLEDIYYYYAFCQYGMEEYLIAAYHFKNIATTYPNGVHAQECLFMNAKCYVNMSPKYELDQEYTNKAINELQLFVNTYPSSPLVSEANETIDLMRNKLQQKAFADAKLYYDMESYKAAAVTFANLIRNYPDTPDFDRASFMILKSNYLYSQNSIESKQAERYLITVNTYNQYKDKLLQSKYAKESQNIFESSNKILNKLKTNESVN